MKCDKGWKPVSISGRDLREQLRNGTCPTRDHAPGNREGAHRQDEGRLAATRSLRSGALPSARRGVFGAERVPHN